jgi:transposase
MAAVRIDSGPVSARDQLRDVPKSKWHDLMLARRQYLEIRLASDCRCLVEFVNDASQMFTALGFASASDMIRDGYKLDPVEISIAVNWLKLREPDEPVSLDQAIKLGKRGRPKKGEEKGCNATLKRGTAAHWLARLDRDGHAELAAQVRAGAISANKAAIEAGFRKQPTPLERIAKLALKLTDLEWAELKRTEDRRRHADRESAA